MDDQHVALDESVSRAVLLAQVTERALHNPNGWTFAIDDVEVPAEPHLDSSGITFYGELVALQPGEKCLELRHRRQLKLAWPVTVERPKLVPMRVRLGPEEDRVGV